MKRKRSNDIQNSLSCDLILTDANGRSVRVHRALLIDKSEYFAKLLADNNSTIIHLDERYLVELIRYLYKYENISMSSDNEINFHNKGCYYKDDDPSIHHGDMEILMNLLALSDKYAFVQLHGELMSQIEYRLSPASVITVYNCALRLGIKKLEEQTKLMILSWLPQVCNSRSFLNLSEESINQIFLSESPDVDNECKLNALSAWWSHNKDADMTNLWVALITCNEK